jgi:hypothetical protein
MDLRRHTRLPVDFTFLVEDRDGGGSLAHAVDISLGGIRFNSVGFNPEESDGLAARFSVGRETFSIPARVVRSRELDSFCHEVAARFHAMEPDTKQQLRRALHGC